ncbi:DUF6310 domain-containing protein [Hyalangium gracile]|uniref:DUF6310 domain-containing protein n=1 Tax=Hyalangium gracile TaxID=394092 RepID=UPI001CCDB6CB|nr:DUF6310 domain-containing protein [Hyalangium gracile]
MLHRACSAPLLLLLLSACATMDSSLEEWEDPSPRFANLQRAAQYPWTDDGHCVVREASNEWPILAERCFHALDRDRVRFRDVTRRCAVASAPAAAAAVPMGVALCVFASPVVVTGAVIVIGTVVVAVLIKESLDAYDRSASHERAKRKAQTRPFNQQEPVMNREPTPRSLGRDWLPPVSSNPTERRPECEPIPVPRATKDDPHNECADTFPPNRYPGRDVSVSGIRFDALQAGVRVLWEIKTHQFDKYNAFIRDREIEKELKQIIKERDAAAACGYDFVVGVSTQAHKDALLEELPRLNVVVTGCTR